MELQTLEKQTNSTKTMNSKTELRDYLIADEINRIATLTRQELIRELIEVKSRTIENSSSEEILKLCKPKQHDD